MYDTCLTKTDLCCFDPMKEKYASLPPYEAKPRWYDSWCLSPSIGKRGKKISVQGEDMLAEHLELYLRLLAEAPAKIQTKLSNAEQSARIYVNIF